LVAIPSGQQTLALLAGGARAEEELEVVRMQLNPWRGVGVCLASSPLAGGVNQDGR
jgi:hypothetical protein